MNAVTFELERAGKYTVTFKTNSDEVYIVTILFIIWKLRNTLKYYFFQGLFCITSVWILWTKFAKEKCWKDLWNKNYRTVI